MKPQISKSQYLKGIQCPKALWLYRNRPDLAPEISDAQQFIFDTGNEVGRLAQQYFPGGVEITDEYYEIDKSIESTQKEIKAGHRYIYEATACSQDGAYSRIDILNKVRGSNKWDLIEVKQSAELKEYHIDDMALQRYAFTEAGYDIRQSILMHLNKSYVRNGDLNLKELFLLEDVTADVKERMQTVLQNLEDLKQVLRKKKEPEIGIGGQCSSPFECEYTPYCWQHIPEYSVYNVFRGKKQERLLADGILDLTDIPDDFDMTDKQRVDVTSFKNGTVFCDRNCLRQFANSLQYPLYYLDYETISPAVPIFDNSSPYQQIPFQFSLHKQDKKGGGVKHFEFLHKDSTDPRTDFIQSLIKMCGKKGSVVVYNQAFESRINNELGKTFPKYKSQIDKITNRMVDLLVPFRSRHLYHPEMNGSASIKSVLPAFVKGMSYSNIDIQDGGAASQSYLTCLKCAVPELERDKIFQNLLEYCKMDTMAEVKLMEVLYKHIK